MTNGFRKRGIRLGRSFGERLKATRVKKTLSIEDVELETKIKATYLEALEKADFNNLPSDVYALGFLRQYSDFLGLDAEVLAEQYKLEKGVLRGMGKNQPHPDKDLQPTRQIKEISFVITLKSVIIGLVVLGLLGLAVYISVQVKNFAAPPGLEIQAPHDQAVIKEDKVEVAGKTEAGASVLINNVAVNLDSAGNFTQEVKLLPGINVIEVLSKNRINKTTFKKIQVLGEF